MTPFRRPTGVFGPGYRKAPLAHLRTIAAVFLASWALGSVEVEARSTFSARFDPSSVAGPGIPQDVLLLLSFFPGDGEAIVSARVGFDAESMQVIAAHSARGALSRSATELKIDYSERPLGSAVTDSVMIELVPLSESTDVPFTGRLYSTQKPDAVAHQASVALGVRPAVDLAMSVVPTQVFVGEQVSLRLQFHNPNPESEVSGVHLKWPDGISPGPGGDNLNTRIITPGDSAVATFTCRIEGDAPRLDLLQGHVISAQAHGSPLPPVELHVSGLPVLGVSAASERLLQGRSQRLTLEWRNPAANGALIADSFRALAPDSFADLAVIDGAVSAKVAAADVSIEEIFFGAHEIVVKGPLTLEPGDRFTIELQAVPRQPGPFEWTGTFVPLHTEREVSAATAGLVWVAPQQAELAEGRDADSEMDGASVLTDLEAVTMAIRERLMQEIRDAPLPRGGRLHLSPTDKKSRNWVVDELLTEALMHQGVTVVVRSPDEIDIHSGIGTMYYRLVDARVIYRPTGGPLKSFFGARMRSRDASGDLLLRLENAAGKVDWVHRVRGSRNDLVNDRHVSWLGSDDVVYAEVNSGNKVLELGLSGSIAIGLLAIFFAP